MAENQSESADAELEMLRKRSADLIAEVCRINERIKELSGGAERAPADPAITDTWVEPKPREDPIG